MDKSPKDSNNNNLEVKLPPWFFRIRSIQNQIDRERNELAKAPDSAGKDRLR